MSVGPDSADKPFFQSLRSSLDKALVVSYEGAKVEDLNTYLAHKLAPLQPIILWGRTASMMPAVPKEHAVYYWWKARSSIKLGQAHWFAPLGLATRCLGFRPGALPRLAASNISAMFGASVPLKVPPRSMPGSDPV